MNLHRRSFLFGNFLKDKQYKLHYIINIIHNTRYYSKKYPVKNVYTYSLKNKNLIDLDIDHLLKDFLLDFKNKLLPNSKYSVLFVLITNQGVITLDKSVILHSDFHIDPLLIYLGPFIYQELDNYGIDYDDLHSFCIKSIKIQDQNSIESEDKLITKKDIKKKFNINKIKHINKIFHTLDIKFIRNNNDIKYEIKEGYNIIVKKIRDDTYEVKVMKDDTVLILFKDFIKDDYYIRYYKNYVLKYDSNGKLYSYNINYYLKSLRQLEKDIKINNNFITMDLETYNDNNVFKVYSIGFYDGEIVQMYYLTDFIDSDDMIYHCFKDILSNPKYSKYTIYFHNFAKFDSLFLIKNLNNHFNLNKIVMRNNSIISLNIKKDHIQLNIKDSYLMLNQSLDKLCKSFNVDTKKLAFNYDIIKKDNIETFKDESLKYLQNDLISLYQVLIKFNKYVFDKTQLNIINYRTISSLAFNVYLSNYYKYEWNVKSINYKIEKDIRNSYFGGIVDVYKPYIENGYYYDMNSQYPNQMLKYDMPIGNPFYSSDNNLDNYFGFCYAKIITPKNMYVPILPIKKEGKLICPLGSWKGWYFSEELKFAKKNGYEIEILGGYKFNRKNIFQNYVLDFYKDKEMSSNDPVKRLFSKSMLNCLYGRFGINEINEKIEIINKDKLNEIIESHNYTYLEEITNDEYLIKYDMNINPKLVDNYDYNNINHKKLNLNSSIAVASAIASYARISINEYKLKYSKDLIYSDTDSIVLSCKLSDEYVGNEIGKMKLEYEIKEGYFINPKTYYILTNDNIEIIKGKGISSAFSKDKLLNKKDFINLYNNNKINKERNIIKRDYIKGEINILKSNITINTEIFKRIKIFENDKWIDTKPLKIKLR